MAAKSEGAISAQLPPNGSPLPTPLAPVSDTELLAHCPPAIVRLLVLLSPSIRAAAALVRLVTWTGPPGSGSHCVSLIMAWWLICLYGYEILRYAPHAIFLFIIASSGVRAAVHYRAGEERPAAASISTAESVNATLADVALLADFASALRAQVVLPFVQLLTWRSGSTKAFAVLLITTWPIWLLCFTPAWSKTGLPSLHLELRGPFGKLSHLLSETGLPFARQYLQRGIRFALERAPLAALQALDRAQVEYMRSVTLYRAHLAQPLERLASLALAVTAPLRRSRQPFDFAVALLPPWPLFSLSLRHALLALGTLAMTWCSPWAALLRHALWRSALVRRMVRIAVGRLSGQGLGGAGLSKVGRSSIWPEASGLGPNERADVSAGASKVTRYEDVVYQFTVFENQRWWMGLDWTAALLPQERPSWSDESHNPVSPPSSFTLPEPRLTLQPEPTADDVGAHTKRLVKWQWIDREWRVAGRDELDEIVAGTPVSALEASLDEAAGTLFDRFQEGHANPGEASALVTEATDSRASSVGAASGPSLLDVDAEGWQYSDNAWERVSRRGGMGKYTRRRRWVRRAVLVEVVERGYHPTQAELDEGRAAEEKQLLEAAIARVGELGDADATTAHAPSSIRKRSGFGAIPEE